MNRVLSVFQDREGVLWFGTYRGVTRYDGRTLTNFGPEDGLVGSVVAICQDREGYLWFGTWGGGVNRYDGKAFKTFTTKDGLPSNDVGSVLQDREGYLWFGTGGLQPGGGAVRYDGKTFINFPQEEAMANKSVFAMMQDRQGHLWFAVQGGGLLRYDGQVFQTFLQQDGLASNLFNGNQILMQDREGRIWVNTLKGATCFRQPPPCPPPVFIDAVVGDQRYEKPSKVAIPSSVRFTVFEFHGVSFKTRQEAMVYRYRLNGYDEGWKNTHAWRVEYQNLPRGDYTFEVQAVDRDLVYSEKPATVRLTIHPPYGTLALAGGLGLALVALTVVSGYAIKRRRDLFREMEKELQTAHDMQMGLMPKASPQIEGFDIAGRCIPANHVGGDFFQYFLLSDNRLALVLADVTGHAMEAAIPAVLFNGILGSQMELGGSIEELYGRLNRSLCRTLIGRTLVCFVMGELNLSTRALSVSDSGCPYPYHFQSATGEVVELQVDAYPLGVRPDTDYPVIEIQLQSGDRVVFCSDGIAEATNASGEQFGYERTAEVIREACAEGLSSERMIDRILSEVNSFRGDAPQADDMTCVVMRVEREKREGYEERETIPPLHLRG